MASGLLVVALIVALSMAFVAYEAVVEKRAVNLMRQVHERDITCRIARVGPTIGMLGDVPIHAYVVCVLRAGTRSLGAHRLEFADMAPSFQVLGSRRDEASFISLVKDGVLYRRKLPTPGESGLAASDAFNNEGKA